MDLQGQDKKDVPQKGNRISLEKKYFKPCLAVYKYAHEVHFALTRRT
jgi:hypothetical protein